MFIRLEDTNKESGIPIIAYDMDDNGNNRPNAEFTVSMPEITFKKDHGSTDQNRLVPDRVVRFGPENSDRKIVRNPGPGRPRSGKVNL